MGNKSEQIGELHIELVYIENDNKLNKCFKQVVALIVVRYNHNKEFN